MRIVAERPLHAPLGPCASEPSSKRVYAPTADRASLHARSQRLQASAHTRQCSMFISVAWRSHSSAHKLQASAQAWRVALAIAGSNSVCLETILPVVAHISEQLR